MPEPDSPNPPSIPEAADQPADERPSGTSRKGRSFINGVMRQIGHVGRDMLSVTLGKWLGEPEQAAGMPQAPSPENQAEGRLDQRVNVMHNVAEKLRGAADSYIAAKMDELEARVDAKLDHIERRIDDKIVQLHQQLMEMRDRELRHRLRLLKITLIFTVLVALLSLGYKWVVSKWI